LKTATAPGATGISEKIADEARKRRTIRQESPGPTVEVTMIRRGVVVAIAMAGIFVAGFWFGGQNAAQGLPKGRVFELRTYTTNEGKLPALQARFRDHTTKILEKHGMKNIGYWVPTDAPASQNTLIYILSFPDREAAKKSWAAFMDDPEWKKVQQESEVNGKLVAKVDSVFMEATDYSPIK
jgi:hypothetical protein